MDNTPKTYATRFTELAYVCHGPRNWRIFATESGPYRGVVGPVYATKAELLGDLTRYARDYGCANA